MLAAARSVPLTAVSYTVIIFVQYSTKEWGVVARGIVVRSLAGVTEFSLLQSGQTGAGGVGLSRGLSGQVAKLTVHSHLDAEVKNEWKCLPLPSMPSWHAYGKCFRIVAP